MKLKRSNHGEIATLLGAQHDVRSINNILENLSHLPKGFKLIFFTTYSTINMLKYDSML